MNRLLEHALVHHLIVPLLIMGMAFPQAAVLAAQPPRPAEPAARTEVFPPLDADSPVFAALGDDDEARAFADRLLKSIGNPDEKEVHVYHIEGLAPDPRLKIVLGVLAQAGVQVKGTLVTKEKFDEVIEQYNRPSERMEQLERFALAYESHAPAAKKGFFSFLRPKNLYAGLKKLKMKLFGLPKGITIFTHFFKKDKDGKWRRRFAPDWKTTLFALGTSVWAVGNIMLVRTLAPLLFGTPEQPYDSAFWIINGLVFAWVYLCLYFQREVASFRSQGVSVQVDPSAPEGEQLTVKQSDSFFTAACLGQEWTLGGAITAILMGMGSVPTNMTVVGNAAMNGALSAYAYIAPEDVKGKWLAEAERVQKDDPKRAAALNTRAIVLATVFWNLIFPTFKNLNLFLPGSFGAAVPFLLLGTLGYGWKQVKNFKQRRKAGAVKVEPPRPAPRCPDLLVITGKRKAER